MVRKKPLRCYICNSEAEEEEEERTGMACCPQHGWMSIQFFETPEEEDSLADEEAEDKEEKSEE